MAHFAFVAHGLTSPLNASLELSRQLTAAGHRVTYISHVDIGDTVAAQGFPFVRLSETQPDWSSGSVANGLGLLRQVPAMRRVRKQSIVSDEVERVISALAPDMLLIDIEMHHPIIVTAGLGIPTMLVMNWLSTYRLPDLPPLDSPLAPGNPKEIRRAWRRVQAAALTARVRHKLSRHGVGDLLRPVSFGTRHYADLKQVARSRGFGLDEHTDRGQWLRPFMYTQLPVLCSNAYEFEFPHTPHPNIRYIGPLVNRDRTEDRIDDTTWQRWRSFGDRRDGRRPLVYCSLGSYWADMRFLRMVLGTFSRRSEWDLVLGLGSQVTEEQLGPVPSNVLILDYAPQLEVLAEADVAINHGGITSINECIANAVPMVVYSPSLLDQDGCAARVEYHRLGVRGDWAHKDPAVLESHIERLLGDRSFAKSLRTMREAFDRYEADGVAVRAVEDHLRKSR